MSSTILLSLALTVLTQAPYDVAAEPDAAPAATTDQVEQAMPPAALALAAAAGDDCEAADDDAVEIPLVPLAIIGVGAVGLVGSAGMYAAYVYQASSLRDAIGFGESANISRISQVEYSERKEMADATAMLAFGLAGASVVTAAVGTALLGAELLQE